MSAWHWPQYVMALLYASSICTSTVKAVCSTNKSSIKLLELAVYILLSAGAVYTLHAGGFW